MNIKRTVAAMITAVSVLSLTACGKDEQPILSNSSAGTPTSNSASDNSTSSAAGEEKEQGMWDFIPEIPVTDESAFKYNYDSEFGGMVITDYLKESPKVRIPDTLEGEPVVGIDLESCEKQITELVVPDTALGINLSSTTEKSLQYLVIPSDALDYDAAVKYLANRLEDVTADDFYKDEIERIYTLFSSYENLSAIGISEKSPRYETSDGMLYYNYGGSRILLVCPQGMTGSVTLPDDLTEIGKNAFAGCAKLTSVTYKGKTYDYEHLVDLYSLVNLGIETTSMSVNDCDKMAEMLVDEMNVYIAYYASRSGWYETEDRIMVEIVITNGVPTVKLNGYNDAAIIAILEETDFGTFENLIKNDLSFGDSGKAVIYTNENGKAYAAIFSESMDAVAGSYAYNEGNIEITSKFEWASENTRGITPEGYIIGTSPKVDGNGTTLA